jgi:hypothetical protein
MCSLGGIMLSNSSNWLTRAVNRIFACHQKPTATWKKSASSDNHQRLTVSLEELDALGGAITQGELALFEYHLNDLLSSLLRKEK